MDKYQEAFGVARAIYKAPYTNDNQRDALAGVFPELRESEDERIRKWLVELVENQEPKMFIEVKKMNVFSWLEKQKDAIGAARQQGYEEGMEDGASMVENVPVGIIKETAKDCITQMKPVEWSEEEKGILLECISALQNSSHWLLADKLSSLRPLPHWKPSKVQMEALAWYSGNFGVPPTGDKAIKSLYDDLKKL